MRGLLATAATLALLAAACSGSEEPASKGPEPLAVTETPAVLERQFGADADGFHLFTPRRRDWDSVVVFVHGHGGPEEITPLNHREWLLHLAARGSAVVYPRYETQPGGHGAARHIEAAVRSALAILGPESSEAPVVGIGYSRGGRLVVDWAAIAAGAHQPRYILSIFPADAEDPSPDLSRLSRSTRILILSGDRDEVVAHYGAVYLLNALERSGFPVQNAHWEIVRSTKDYAVRHLSPLDHSPRGRELFWRPADRLIEQARYPTTE